MGRLTKYGEDGRMRLFTHKGEYGNEIIVTIDGALRKLAHYEDMEEAGRLIEVDKIEKELEQSTSAEYICENGTVISTDVGYVEEWLKEYVKVLKELEVKGGVADET